MSRNEFLRGRPPGPGGDRFLSLVFKIVTFEQFPKLG
jgi:hypothetical protein